VRTGDIGAQAFAQFEADVVRAARAQLPEDISLVATGTSSLAYRGVNRITADLRASLLGTAVLVTLLIALLLRSVAFGLISIPPNAAPLLLGYAGFAVIGIPLDPLAMVVLTVALGIAVDDTIHLMVRFCEADPQATTATAIRDAIEHGGRAITVTSLVLAIGLGVNLLSSFPPLRILGGLGAAIMLIALACDLLILPALLMLVFRRPPADDRLPR
jgi:hypothetical protein